MPWDSYVPSLVSGHSENLGRSSSHPFPPEELHSPPPPPYLGWDRPASSSTDPSQVLAPPSVCSWRRLSPTPQWLLRPGQCLPLLGLVTGRGSNSSRDSWKAHTAMPPVYCSFSILKALMSCSPLPIPQLAQNMGGKERRVIYGPTVAGAPSSG